MDRCSVLEVDLLPTYYYNGSAEPDQAEKKKL
jgi:hypothetical protein